MDSSSAANNHKRAKKNISSTKMGHQIAGGSYVAPPFFGNVIC
jgi:hypothetical protein